MKPNKIVRDVIELITALGFKVSFSEPKSTRFWDVAKADGTVIAGHLSGRDLVILSCGMKAAMDVAAFT